MNKILILFINLFKIGGIEEYNRHLCNAFAIEFPEYKFIAISLYDTGKNKISRWHNIRIKFCGWVGLNFIKRVFFIFRTIQIVFIKKPKFLICTHANLVCIALFCKKIFGIKYVLMSYGVDVWNIKNGIKYKGLKNAHMIIAISQYTKSKMVANGVSDEKIKLLQPAVDTSFFNKKEVNHFLSSKLALQGKKILLTVGRINAQEKYKGHDIMLRVMQQLDDNYVWVVVGRGNDLIRLKRKAEKLGVIGKIRFIGFVEKDKLIDYYNLCDIFILLSKGEGFGTVFLEAMACGKPVIGGNKDGSTEALMGAKLGFMLNPDDIEEIIKMIKVVCVAKENRTNPEYLRREVEAYFGITTFNKRVRKVFNEVLT